MTVKTIIRLFDHEVFSLIDSIIQLVWYSSHILHMQTISLNKLDCKNNNNK